MIRLVLIDIVNSVSKSTIKPEADITSTVMIIAPLGFEFSDTDVIRLSAKFNEEVRVEHRDDIEAASIAFNSGLEEDVDISDVINDILRFECKAYSDREGRL